MATTGCILYPQVHLGSIWGLRGHNLAPKWAKMSQNPDMAKGAVFGHFWASALTNYIFFTILVHNKSQQVIISQKKLVQAMNRFWWGDQNGPLYHSAFLILKQSWEVKSIAQAIIWSSIFWASASVSQDNCWARVTVEPVMLSLDEKWNKGFSLEWLNSYLGSKVTWAQSLLLALLWH